MLARIGACLVIFVLWKMSMCPRIFLCSDTITKSCPFYLGTLWSQSSVLLCWWCKIIYIQQESTKNYLCARPAPGVTSCFSFLRFMLCSNFSCCWNYFDKFSQMIFINLTCLDRTQEGTQEISDLFPILLLIDLMTQGIIFQVEKLEEKICCEDFTIKFSSSKQNGIYKTHFVKDWGCFWKNKQFLSVSQK